MGIRLVLSKVKWPVSRDHYFTIYMVHERTIPTISFKVEWLYSNFLESKPPKTPLLIYAYVQVTAIIITSLFSYVLSVSIFIAIYIINDCIITPPKTKCSNFNRSRKVRMAALGLRPEMSFSLESRSNDTTRISSQCNNIIILLPHFYRLLWFLRNNIQYLSWLDCIILYLLSAIYRTDIR